MLVTAMGWSRWADAQVFQIDSVATPLPQPVSEAERNLVTSSWAYQRDTVVTYDADGNVIFDQGRTFGDFYPTFEDDDAITLQGLFKWRGESIDPVADATNEPGYFEPTCGFRAELVLLGGTCPATFGWYNVDDPSSTDPPASNELYVLIPANHAELMTCQPPLDGGFCPLAWDNVDPRALNQTRWTPVTFTALLENDPRYTGGYVGFAMIADPGSACSVNKHSLASQNQQSASGAPWVTVLQYRSTLDPNGFYLGFEDLPMSEADWRQTGVPGVAGTNDGDFNDMVFYVSGADCDLCIGDCDDRTTTATSGTTMTTSGSTTATSGSTTATSGSTTAASGSTAGGVGGSGGSATSTAATTTATVSSDGSGGLGEPGTTSSGATSVGNGGSADTGDAGAPSDGLSCTPGRQLECTCADGSQGAQVCSDDGGKYLPCQCAAPAQSDEGGCGCRLLRMTTRESAPLGQVLTLTLVVALVVRRKRTAQKYRKATPPEPRAAR